MHQNCVGFRVLEKEMLELNSFRVPKKSKKCLSVCFPMYSKEINIAADWKKNAWAKQGKNQSCRGEKAQVTDHEEEETNQKQKFLS